MARYSRSSRRSSYRSSRSSKYGNRRYQKSRPGLVKRFTRWVAKRPVEAAALAVALGLSGYLYVNGLANAQEKATLFWRWLTEVRSIYNDPDTERAVHRGLELQALGPPMTERERTRPSSVAGGPNLVIPADVIMPTGDVSSTGSLLAAPSKTHRFYTDNAVMQNTSWQYDPIVAQLNESAQQRVKDIPILVDESAILPDDSFVNTSFPRYESPTASPARSRRSHVPPAFYPPFPVRPPQPVLTPANLSTSSAIVPYSPSKKQRIARAPPAFYPPFPVRVDRSVLSPAPEAATTSTALVPFEPKETAIVPLVSSLSLASQSAAPYPDESDYQVVLYREPQTAIEEYREPARMIAPYSPPVDVRPHRGRDRTGPFVSTFVQRRRQPSDWREEWQTARRERQRVRQSRKRSRDDALKFFD